ncbi:MAG: NAD-dependent epimerase/dehydratase family protein [Gemmatimonadaceae bacterium]|nr:NAD-dependent epimerase/dehydratase family protein [Gemmatimonadaceae bacterium]
MSLALITGASGLVGTHLVERLRRDGWELRALVRDRGTAGWLMAQGVELRDGDTQDAAAFRRAAEGAQVVFHCAAAITPRGGWEAYRAPNIDGTANAVDAAARAGARLLHLSSVAVYGPEGRYALAHGEGLQELQPLPPIPAAAWYARSKRESETLVMDAHRTGRVWATAVRPCVIYGPRDRQFIPRVAAVLRLPVVPRIGMGRAVLSIVHARSVAEVAVRAVTSEIAGGRAYNVTNDTPLSVSEFYEAAQEGLGVRPRWLPISGSLVQATMGGLGAALRALRIPGSALLTPRALDFLLQDNPFSSERARIELGWTSTVDSRAAVVEAFRSCAAH